MARPLRITFAGACYHVTARGNERRAIYADDPDREDFLGRLEAVVRRYDVVLHAYVLMRNHYHLLLETPGANLARAMRQLNGVYTQDFNRRHRRVGRNFWQTFRIPDTASALPTLAAIAPRLPENLSQSFCPLAG